MTKPSRWARAHAANLTDRITVSARRGGGGHGPSFAQPVTVLGFAKASRTLTVGEDGEEAAGQTVLRLPPVLVPVDEHGDPVADAAEVAALDLFALGSEVTALGRTGHVVAVAGVTFRGRLERVDVTAS